MTARPTAPRPNCKRLMALHPWLRRVRHKQSCGQSAAVRSGVVGGARAAGGDARRRRPERSGLHPGDAADAGSGDPTMGLVAGQRVGRKAVRLQENAIAHRQCGARRGAARRHPRHRLRAEGVSPRRVSGACLISTACIVFCRRWSSATASRIGYVDVVDRPRGAGVSNYGLWDRLWVGILDLAGVWWLIRRKKRVPEISEN